MLFTDAQKTLKIQNRTSNEDKELSEAMKGLDFTNNKNDLLDLNFSKLTLRNVIFNGATIMNCNFDYSTLENCTFEGASIGANEGETSFNWAISEGTNFNNTRIWNTSFYGAYLKDATFENSEMSGVSFADSILLNTTFNKSVFDLDSGETDFDGAITIGATFENIEAFEDDDVNPVVGLINDHNPSKHLNIIKGLDENKIIDYFKRIIHLKQIRDNNKLRPLRKLVINSLKGEDLIKAKEMFPNLFPGQGGMSSRKKKTKSKTKKRRHENRFKKHKTTNKNIKAYVRYKH